MAGKKTILKDILNIKLVECKASSKSCVTDKQLKALYDKVTAIRKILVKAMALRMPEVAIVESPDSITTEVLNQEIEESVNEDVAEALDIVTNTEDEGV